MKRALLTAAIISLAAGGLVTVVPAAAAHAAATVVNPDFNESGGTTTPPGWSTYSPDGTASASYTEVTSNGYGGDAYQLTHWSSAAYNVDTYQILSGLSAGFYTLGVWTRSSGGDVSDRIALTGCGGPNTPTAVPADSDGAWVQIVTYVRVTSGHCTINLVTDGNAGDWTNFDGVTFTPGAAPIAIRGGDVSSLYRSELDGGVYYTSSGVAGARWRSSAMPG